MELIYFYHGFPPEKDIGLGLQILDSVLGNGFLLTAEAQRVAATRNLEEKIIVQRRACFTAIPASLLTAHAEYFGPFALEFAGQALRDFGVLPVVYSAGKMPGGTMLDGAGQVLARQLLESYWVMSDLVEMVKKGQKAVATEIWQKAQRRKLPPEELQYCLEALLNLIYPTDEAGTDEFFYFKEREWRIVPNLALADGVWNYPPPTPEQAKKLRALNPGFFDEQLGDKTQLEHCAFLRNVAGQDVISRVRRIVVPQEVLADARAIAVRHGFKPESVVSAAEPEFSPGRI
jgi:hypothetical protein